jgi:replicative DNA helicase
MTRLEDQTKDIHNQLLSSDVLVQYWDMWQKDRIAHPELYKLRSTGLRSLDHILGGGVEFGQLVIYGGEQKIGKSTLLQHTAMSFGKHKDSFAYFSGEMSNLSIGTRLLCSLAGIDKSKVRGMNLDLADWAALHDAKDELASWKSWWNYGFKTLDDIYHTLNKIKKETGIVVPTIFVDYVQLMEYPKLSNRNEQLSAISRGLKRMTLEFGQPMLVFVAAQTNRESIRKNIIDANSFLGSGAFERDMDLGIIIHKTKDDRGNVIPHMRMLTIVGSRDTDVGEPIAIEFNGKTSQIRDASKSSAEMQKLDYWAD